MANRQSYQTDFRPTHLTLPHPQQSQKMKGVGTATSWLVFYCINHLILSYGKRDFVWDEISPTIIVRRYPA